MQIHKVVILASLLTSNLVYADAYHGKEDIKPDGKPTIVYPRNPKGALYPFKTYQTDDAIRPKWWNGYGIDPTGPNYWHYFNENNECNEGYREIWEGTEWECKIEEAVEQETANIDEPSTLLLTLTGLLAFLYWRKYG